MGLHRLACDHCTPTPCLALDYSGLQVQVYYAGQYHNLPYEIPYTSGIWPHERYMVVATNTTYAGRIKLRPNRNTSACGKYSQYWWSTCSPATANVAIWYKHWLNGQPEPEAWEYPTTSYYAWLINLNRCANRIYVTMDCRLPQYGLNPQEPWHDGFAANAVNTDCDQIDGLVIPNTLSTFANILRISGGSVTLSSTGYVNLMTGEGDCDCDDDDRSQSSLSSASSASSQSSLSSQSSQSSLSSLGYSESSASSNSSQSVSDASSQSSESSDGGTLPLFCYEVTRKVCMQMGPNWGYQIVGYSSYCQTTPPYPLNQWTDAGDGSWLFCSGGTTPCTDAGQCYGSGPESSDPPAPCPANDESSASSASSASSQSSQSAEESSASSESSSQSGTGQSGCFEVWSYSYDYYGSNSYNVAGLNIMTFTDHSDGWVCTGTGSAEYHRYVGPDDGMGCSSYYQYVTGPADPAQCPCPF